MLIIKDLDFPTDTFAIYVQNTKIKINAPQKFITLGLLRFCFYIQYTNFKLFSRAQPREKNKFSGSFSLFQFRKINKKYIYSKLCLEER